MRFPQYLEDKVGPRSSEVKELGPVVPLASSYGRRRPRPPPGNPRVVGVAAQGGAGDNVSVRARS